MADRRLSILIALADAGRAEDIAAYVAEEKRRELIKQVQAKITIWVFNISIINLSLLRAGLSEKEFQPITGK